MNRISRCRPCEVHGLLDTWAQWLTIASADAVVLSASNFGVTAAEAGRVPIAFLGAYGCRKLNFYNKNSQEATF